ncbi:MAG: carboxy terminal-processing peptidase [Bacteroidetes bacterium]|nr:carboxy terminal-processing peptidase [Bacteroidota bacterium]
MNFKKITTLGLFVGLFFLFSSYREVDKNQTLLNVMIQGLTFGHFQPQEINDEFSHKVYDLFLKRIDYNKRFLLKEDIEKLNQYRNQLDEETSQGSYEFFNIAVEILKQRMAEAKDYYTTSLTNPFDFTKDETLELEGKKAQFQSDKEALKDKWYKQVKYETMLRVAEMQQTQEKAIEKKDTAFKVRTYAQIEEDARKKTLKANDEWFKRLQKMENNEWRNIYLNAIASTYDPHTEFFPPKDKENFDIQMSGQFQGIGAQLQQRDGIIKVENIIPGSASWRQGQLKAGDVILKVAQASADPVDVSDMALDKAVELIRGKKDTEVRLTVRKVDGTIIIIPIIRDVVIIEETYAQSMIIQNNGHKTGYIKLPLFYADFNKEGGRRCAEDVRKEVEKLKEEKVEGIIIDLRNNGGGSLQDVVEMGGLFIDKGPIVQVKDRVNSPQLLLDHDPETVYSGPLAIMVNNNSASASEILAAAMQDYKRAVIIGTSSTFGKGTVQKFMDLDNIVNPSYDEVKPLGQVKLTIQKFYRINGGATQLKGVIPDVILPDAYALLDLGEKEQDYPMKWDEIKPANYTPWSKYNIAAISSKSKERVKKNESFALVNEEAKRVKTARDRTTVSLNLEKYKAEEKKRIEEGKKFDKLRTEVKGLEVFQLKSDEALNTDSVKVIRTKEMIKTLKKDFNLNEALNVIGDMR